MTTEHGAITGADLIAWGFRPSRRFGDLIAAANAMRDAGDDDGAIQAHLAALETAAAPIPIRTNAIPFGVFLEADGEAEQANRAAVIAHMDALMRVPTIKAGAVMPDACPSGVSLGTIPVGGVVACEDAIHPGFHSSDICCSVAITTLKRRDDPGRVLDVAQQLTHFGPGRRKDIVPAPRDIAEAFAANPFLRDIDPDAQFATQGDGNHFLFVGTLGKTGERAIVTHHGSRGPGAMLYKRGMAAAKRHTGIVAHRVPDHQSWLKADSEAGRSYWEALQIVRRWTKASHFAIHEMIARALGNRIEDQFWNEHNFVFQRADGLYYHAKGATPSFRGWWGDGLSDQRDTELTLIPMNMAAPILICAPGDNAAALDFAPHGAGRNIGRKAFMRGNPDALAPPPGIDLRSYCGRLDPSELPAAYKDHRAVIRQIEAFKLARVVDRIEPHGCIMAGDWEADAPWRTGKPR